MRVPIRWVCWGFGSHEESQNAGAHRIIESPAQLIHTVHSIA